MNVNWMIETALSSLDIPVKANVYTGKSTEYITFNYADERPVVYADGTDILDETIVQVHLFTKNNPQSKKKSIRKLLRAAGFSIQSTAELYENDTGYNHVIVYAWIAGDVDDTTDDEILFAEGSNLFIVKQEVENG